MSYNSIESKVKCPKCNKNMILYFIEAYPGQLLDVIKCDNCKYTFQVKKHIDKEFQVVEDK